MTSLDLDLSALSNEQENTVRGVNFFSSICFLLGSTTWTVSFFLSPGTNDTVFEVCTYSAYGILMFHALVEFYLDLCYGRRKIIHSRFGKGSCLNVAQTLTFMIALITEVLYFWCYMRELYQVKYGQGVYHDLFRPLYLGASHGWFLSAILTFWSRSCFVRGAGLDNIGNIIYLIGAILMYASGLVLFFEPNDDISFLLKWWSSIAWTVAGVLYSTRDFLQMRRPKRTSGATTEALHSSSQESSSEWTWNTRGTSSTRNTYGTRGTAA